MRLFLASALVLLSSCKTPDPGSQMLAVAPDGATYPLSLEVIDGEAQFQAVSKEASGIIKNGRIMKFFVDARDAAKPVVHFINANYTENGKTPDAAKYHYDFAKATLNVPEELEEFNNQTYFTEQKRYMAGTVQTYKLDGNADVLYGIGFYPQDVIHGAATLAATQLVAKQLRIPGAKFAFVETGSQQKTDDVAAQFQAAGVERLSLEKILGAITYIPMNQGEAWGYLRIFPVSQDELSAADIPVFDELPLDLTVVAGTITRAYQDSNSHVNLKSKERGTPNAVLRDASPTHPRLSPFANKPVHLTIGPEGFQIEVTTDEAIKAKLAERANRPWTTITWDATTEILSYDAMCKSNPADCLKQGRKYGSKAANLGFLAHKRVLGRKATAGTMSNRLGYDLVPVGFGLPLQFYKDFVDANPELKGKIAALVEKEKGGTLSAAQRVQLLAEVQGLFYKGAMPTDMLKAVKAKMQEVLPGIDKVKVRSSANAEDIEGFDGAGLHDSYSAKPAEQDNADGRCVREEDEEEGGGGETKAKMRPRTLQCAIKGVYASLWNKRAIEERSFSRIDHASVSMGISVLPAYDYESKVAANSVVVTRVLNTSDVYGYTLSVQKKNNLVTNPDPGTWSEVTIAALGLGSEPTSLTVTRFAKPKADKPQLTASVLPRDRMLQMVDLSRAVEEAYCRAKPGYYEGDCGFVAVDVEKPKSLDMEMKYLENGHYVVKQCREFSGR